MMKTAALAIFLACAAAETCDGQNSAVPGTVGCATQLVKDPCAHTYAKKMSDKGCGAGWQFSCYECCVDESDTSICNPSWTSCEYGHVGKSVTCPKAVDPVAAAA